MGKEHHLKMEVINFEENKTEHEMWQYKSVGKESTKEFEGLSARDIMANCLFKCVSVKSQPGRQLDVEYCNIRCM